MTVHNFSTPYSDNLPFTSWQTMYC